MAIDKWVVMSVVSYLSLDVLEDSSIPDLMLAPAGIVPVNKEYHFGLLSQGPDSASNPKQRHSSHPQHCVAISYEIDGAARTFGGSTSAAAAG